MLSCANMLRCAPDWDRARGFRYHLVPRTEYRKSSDAQVILKLAHLQQVRQAKVEAQNIIDDRYVDPRGKTPITAIFDEDDLNIQSFSRNVKVTEHESSTQRTTNLVIHPKNPICR